MKIVVTGGAGFIGSNFIEYLGAKEEASLLDLVVVDSCTYASDRKRLVDILNKSNFRTTQFLIADITQKTSPLVNMVSEAEFIFHFAAESHVDNSIDNAMPFVTTNIVGTQNLLDIAKNGNCKRFIHVSTDEVYGSLEMFHAPSKENSPIAPNSPYSASKASSDLLVRSYVQTHGFPAIITRCCNNFGRYQHSEKFIPKMIQNAWEGEKLPIYGTGMNVREWIDVRDHCRAIWFVARVGEPGDIFNVGSGVEKPNITVACDILNMMGVKEDLIEMVEDRKGHDFRYALNSSRLRNMGFKLKYSYEDTLRDAIQWYKPF